MNRQPNWPSAGFALLVTSVVFFPAAISCAQEPGSVVDRATIFAYDKTDPYDRSNEFGFNHAPSVTHLAGQRVMAAWFSGPYEASVHQVILAAASADAGRTWGEAQTFHDTSRTSDFDPCFIDAGDVAFAFFSTGRWTRWPYIGTGAEARKKVGASSFQIFFQRSDDHGRTWTEPHPPLIDPGWNCRSNGIRLRSGELILPSHCLEVPYRASALISADDGETWVRSSLIRGPEQGGAAEPSIAECSSGSLLMVVRTRDGRLWMSRSTDRGHNWSDLAATDLPAAASSHHIMSMSDGRLVLTHNPTEPPLRTGLTLRVSDDDGHSWSEPLLLAQVPPARESESIYSRQVSYPSACELPDGAILVVWTRIELSPIRQQGVIECARVQLK